MWSEGGGGGVIGGGTDNMACVSAWIFNIENLINNIGSFFANLKTNGSNRIVYLYNYYH